MKDRFFHRQLQFCRSFKKKLNEKLSAAELYYSQWLVLYCIKHMQPVTLVEIGNYLAVEKPTISRTVKRLDQQGLIKEMPSQDKRERRVCLTDVGEERYGQGQKIVFQFEAELLTDISQKDLDTTMRTIQHLQEKLKKGEID